ncbi:putative restriction endonuclease [Sedimentibacter acidaminivorans]|uniref:Restriction endonuclease n=1 Tax=Sedimentibacter acidaminivorans TaxID=913099 RepID=A0ABS4GHC9_9FIRM|nr:hypothetical protein [Sedimentibacter acidaminivorans]MBP1927101.1 putative restriction endonuclease [Sedimentibacter acidaminivorans]
MSIYLKPLSDNGSQDEYNVVILCPNHHRMMHYADVKIFEREESKRKLIVNNIEKYIIYK